MHTCVPDHVCPTCPPAHLQALASIETLRPEDIPGDQDLEIIESYVTSAEDFLASVSV
jgi:hypothetical protein